MKNILKIIVASFILTACATKNDVSLIQTQIDGVKQDIEQVQINSLIAKVTAYGAAESSANAESAMITTLDYTTKINEKLDKIFLDNIQK
ncbi:MAG: alanine-zipper protein [Flavobacterium sp.]|uniref:alanine-zipper protein n=1 Tax=Flavobacterium sp. TaxID=239 RepID=UPI00262914FA|nr:alanine-zipper protein [Flavobacterium sp.]MDD5150681.1 alanine-zipper protein [Flavobacterium sp.]